MNFPGRQSVAGRGDQNDAVVRGDPVNLAQNAGEQTRIHVFQHGTANDQIECLPVERKGARIWNVMKRYAVGNTVSLGVDSRDVHEVRIDIEGCDLHSQQRGGYRARPDIASEFENLSLGRFESELLKNMS